MTPPAQDPDATWPPTPETIDRAKAGDRSAVESVLRYGHPRLISFFIGSGAQKADAEDLAAHTCEAIVSSIHKLKNTQAFEGWFWQIARFTFRGWLRRHRRPTRYEPDYVQSTGPQDQLDLSEDHSQIRAALDALPSKDRQLLWLRDVEGLSYDEIGGRVGSAVGTIRVACHRARKRLEDAYHALDADD